MTIQVILADDQAMIRSGLAQLLRAYDDLEVVGQASNGREAVALARQLHPDVVLMDIRMPEMDGVQATQAIRAEPTLADVRVLVLTTFETEDYVLAALRAGAAGFLGKTMEADELAEAIRVVMHGDELLSPAATKALFDHFRRPAESGPPDPRLAGLTEREVEVLRMVAQGLSNDEIAAKLVISPLTVKTHVGRIMTKTDAHDRATLVVFAYDTGAVG